jgi:hypothetical protein
MSLSPRSPKLTIRAMALMVAVLACTAVGAWQTTSMAAAKPDPATLVVNGVSYTVTHAEQVKGLSDADLGGMAHGIQSLVSDDKVLVKVTLIVSAGDSPASHDASVLLAFAQGSAEGVAPVGGTLSPGKLSAHARIEGTVSFVFARNGAQIALRAPGSSRQVPLLQVDKTVAGAATQTPSGTSTPQHHHPAPAPTPGGTSPSNHR